MGSSGEKRKGRRHLPKVGTRPAMEQELHDRRTMALHPFSAEPIPRRRNVWGIGGIVVALIAAIGVIALVVAT
ncbi:MAG: hypothetical protein ABW122_00500 [Ilumatobacteraceae bacterium]